MNDIFVLLIRSTEEREAGMHALRLCRIQYHQRNFRVNKSLLQSRKRWK
jgi:hypothetical protein